MTETYSFLVLWFQRMLTKWGIFLFGARLSLLIMTPLVHILGDRSMRLSIYKTSIKIAEAWIPMIKQYNSRSMRTYEGKPSNNWNNNEDQNAPMAVNQLATNSDM